jgi:hypothetical protein
MTYQLSLTATQPFILNQRVQAHPATDTWMRGDRYGTVKKIGRRYIHVLMDRSGRTIRFDIDNLLVD